jgi:diguanylate cyclase (GGDEF)-like protein
VRGPATPSYDLGVLHEIVKALTSTLELPQILQGVLARMKHLTRAEATSLLLYDPEREELVFAATETLSEGGPAHAPAAVPGCLASWVFRTGRSAVVNDVEADLRCGGSREPLPPCDGRHLLAVPLRRGEQVVGVIEIADRYDGLPFEDTDRAAVEAVVAAAGEVDSETLSRDPAAVRRILRDVTAAVPTQAATLLLVGEGGRELQFSASRRLQPGLIDGLRMSVQKGIAGWVARHREPLLLEDASEDPRHDRSIESETQFRPHGMICVPLVSKGALLGVIQVMNRLDGRPFDESEFTLVQVLADYAAIAIENASLYHRAEVASLTDDLTGMGNTRQLGRVLSDLIGKQRPFALIVLDFDNFKQVVDGYGHLVGSQTIAYLGRRMARLLRPGDFAARFGGDEFVIVMPDADAALALEIAERLRAEIAGSTTLEGSDVDISGVTASLGLAVFPDHGADADGLLHVADKAMYEVKRAAKNGVILARQRDQ